MNWINLSKELPPPNTVVWVKRTENKVEKEPIYLAMRNGKPISTDIDASRNTHWNGQHKDTVFNQLNPYRIDFNASFSDVTVVSWAYVECP